MSNPKFNRRHHEFIAQVLRDISNAVTAPGACTYSTNAFADAFAQDNPRFDRNRFMDAVMRGPK